MKFIIVIPALIGLAAFLFIAARLNRMRAAKVKRSILRPKAEESNERSA